MRDAVFRAIADPQRRKILKLLQQRSMTAGQIAARFDITKGSLSYHFNVLKGAGLIRCERRAQVPSHLAIAAGLLLVVLAICITLHAYKL
jgi:DNA-binding transcriptional ArsR family regulator